jgi:putative addiction module component (TIGR02574 family)
MFLMSIAELRQLPRREKLQIVEALWSDLAIDGALVQSPTWHGDQLRKTEEDLKLGKVQVVSWESAKKKLRKQFE